MISDEAASLPTTPEWSARNQAYLSSMIASVRADLQRRLAASAGSEAEPIDRPATGAVPAQPFALERLCRAFNLSAFERDLLVLCAGVELESDFAKLCAAINGEPQRDYPTFGLALATLSEAHWSALSPAAPLRHWRLIEIGATERLVASPLRIDERVLHYLIGVDCSERRLRGMIEPVADQTALPPSYITLAEQAAHALALSASASTSPVVLLAGADRTSQRSIAAVICDRLGLELSAAPVESLPRTPSELEDTLQLWRREAILGRRGLLIEAQEADSTDAATDMTIARIVQNAGSVVLVGGRLSLRTGYRPIMRIDIPPLSSIELRILWAKGLGRSAVAFAALPSHRTDVLLAQFRLTPAGVQAAATQALANLAAGGDTQAHSTHAVDVALWSACRAQSRSALDRLAKRIEPAAGWADLILPNQQRNLLEEITSHLRQGAVVYDGWGFASKSARGLGVSVLFSGPSGTGKTTAAEVLAKDLDLDLYRIDLSQIVNKYIGETEKNLGRVFDAAETSGAILLFDEADALFGKRSEVKDSHDRYANLEVSYLLQRMETYRGLAILTTNMKAALDPAFMRRLRFVVQFPFPDLAQREEIWRAAFPPQAPTEGLDTAKLARLSVTGGHVRNIALSAAFLAAGVGQPVRMEHILCAARSECAKIDRPIAEAEIRGWI